MLASFLFERSKDFDDAIRVLDRYAEFTRGDKKTEDGREARRPLNTCDDVGVSPLPRIVQDLPDVNVAFMSNAKPRSTLGTQGAASDASAMGSMTMTILDG
jgi:hypothetical protein